MIELAKRVCVQVQNDRYCFMDVLLDVAAFPGLGKLIGTIQHKKVKDNVVLSFVIAGCICFLLWLFIL